MSIRRDPIYISSDVYRWLRLLSKAEFENVRTSGEFTNPDRPTIATADQIADQILRQAIREQHPQLSEHEKEIAKLEKTLIESLRTNENKTISRTGDKSSES